MNNRKSVRLSENYIKVIKNNAFEFFGDKTRVLVFGSRTNLNAKGGDIDLYIIPETKDNILERELKFSVKIKMALGEQKIDIVIQENSEKLIEKIALSKGVEI